MDFGISEGSWNQSLQIPREDVIFLFVVFILIKILKECFLELYKFVMRFIQQKTRKNIKYF